MKKADDELNRLLKAAAAAPQAPPGAAVFALEARVLGHWRGAARADSGEFLVSWFRRAAICGAMLAVGSLAWNELPTRQSVELTMADSTMSMGVEP
jgi:hypothetical protein